MSTDATKTILVVDDEWMLLETIAFNLEREGFNVMKASDGESALERVRELSPDLVILDLMLPKLSGWDVCRTLRQSAEFRLEAPILIVSALAEQADKDKSFRAGATDYMLKPFQMKELVAQAKVLLEKPVDLED